MTVPHSLASRGTLNGARLANHSEMVAAIVQQLAARTHLVEGPCHILSQCQSQTWRKNNYLSTGQYQCMGNRNE